MSIIKSLLKLKHLGFYPKNILDIGAHHGRWSININKHVYPKSNYTLIEAIDYKELNKINNFENMEYKILLLNDKEEEIIWYQKEYQGDSIYKENTKHYDNCKEIKRIATTLDIEFSDIKFDLIKIDCQGAEIPILKGGINTIKNTSVIILEVPFMGEYNKGVSNFLEHVRYMDSIGFIPFDISEMHNLNLDNIIDILIQIDIVFIRKEHIINDKVKNIINNIGS